MPRVPEGHMRQVAAGLLVLLRRLHATSLLYAEAKEEAAAPDFPVYCINLDKQPDKMERVEEGVRPAESPGSGCRASSARPLPMAC